jgi:hypothetical protein
MFLQELPLLFLPLLPRPPMHIHILASSASVVTTTTTTTTTIIHGSIIRGSSTFALTIVLTI